MSTSSTTESCTCACKAKRGPLPYTPGSSIFTKIVSARKKGARLQRTWHTGDAGRLIPDEVLQMILSILAKQNDGRSVILMSMVNQGFRRLVQGDWTTWLTLYNKWLMSYFRFMSLETLPNFRRRFHPQWIRREIRDTRLPERWLLLLKFMRKIIVLKHIQRCGMCGSTRNQVTPFWSLGMSVCRYCVQDNMVTDTWLYETCFFTFCKAWAHQISGRVFYFRAHTTARERTEWTLDSTAFAGTQQSWNYFFWRPHLEGVIDIPRLQGLAIEKKAAARIIRAFARRSMVMHKMSRIRGATLKDKRPIHARMLAKDRSATRSSIDQSVIPTQDINNHMLLWDDYVPLDWEEALAIGRTRI